MHSLPPIHEKLTVCLISNGFQKLIALPLLWIMGLVLSGMRKTRTCHFGANLGFPANPLINATGETLHRSTGNNEAMCLDTNGISSNTNRSQAPQLTCRILVRAVILASLGGLSLAANGATLFSICCQHTRRSAPHGSSLYTFLAHMAVADSFVAAFCPLAEAAWTYTVSWLAESYLQGGKIVVICSLHTNPVSLELNR